MRLSDFIVREAILVDLEATSKDAAVAAMVDSLVRAGCFPEADREGVIRAVLDREALGTTGIGRGVACPEARHHAIRGVIGTIALPRSGVDFGAIDGEPADLLTLLLAAPQAPGPFLLAGRVLSRHLADESFCARLRRARTRGQVIAILDEADREIRE